MPRSSQTDGVHFTPGETGSSLFRAALVDAVGAYPDVFPGLEVPSAKAFKKALPEWIGHFESLRAGSASRVDIARTLAGAVTAHARLGPEGRPLAEALTDGPSTRREIQGTGPVGWSPTVSWGGRSWSGPAIGELASTLHDEGQITAGCASALTWVADELLGQPVDLRGHRFAILGAAAELAPTPCLLRAGARVLWVDRTAPDATIAQAPTWGGTLVHDASAGDLLADPAAAFRAVHAENADGPVNLGLYAYAPGRGRELRLTAAMNSIAAKVDGLSSVSMLVSPTTPGVLTDAEVAANARRRQEVARWKRGLARVGALSEPGHVGDGVPVARSIVPLQGPTYLAAQYLTKMMVAEAWATDRAPTRVSANVAGITHTASLEHPLFLAGFIGAPTFGITIFTPAQTRVLTTLLLLHDLLRSDAPGADRSGGPAAHAARVTGQAIHGGVRATPFGFMSVIQVAAVIGLGKKPSLLLRLRG